MTGKRVLLYWLCQLSGWLTVAGFYLIAARLRGGPDSPIDEFVVVLGASAIVAIGWTHLYRGLLRRWGWAALGPARLLPRVLGASLVLGAVIPFTAAPVWYQVFGGRTEPVRVWAPSAVMGWSWTVLMWNIVYFGVHYLERLRRAELDRLQLAVAAAEAKLYGLMSQLNPHFLFNCLNSVRALIVEDPAKAQRTVTELSHLMRYSLQAARVARVPLATEMAMVATYLSLETVRLDERLTSRLDVAPETTSVEVPTMLVQSLVENGVKHGIEPLPAGGNISVAAWLEQGSLRVRVTNSGRIAARDDGSTRLGLANARDRLRLLYGTRASLALADDGDGRVIADLSLPVGEGRVT